MKTPFKLLALVFLVAMTVLACKKSTSTPQHHSFALIAGTHLWLGTEEDNYPTTFWDSATNSPYEVQVDTTYSASRSTTITIVDSTTITIQTVYGSTIDTLHTNTAIDSPNSICFTGGNSDFYYTYNQFTDVLIYNYSTNAILWNEQFIPKSPTGLRYVENFKLHTP